MQASLVVFPSPFYKYVSMGFTDTLDVLEQCQISPPSVSVPKVSLPLTFFDLFWVTKTPVQRLFFYECHHPKSYFMDTILPNMKHSLSLTLQHFFPFAGHLTWPQYSIKPEILYVDGDLVSFIVAESGYDFYTLVANHVKNDNEFYSLVPELLNMSNDNKIVPVLALQVTLFPNNGICIGVTYNHAVADGGIVIQFMRSWASVCKLQGNTDSLIKSPLCYDRTMVKDPKGIEKIFLNSFSERNINKDTFNTAVPKIYIDPTDKVRSTFVITQTDIKRLKEWILSRLSTPPLHLSTFVVTCAYVWTCLVKATWGENGANASEDQIKYFGFSIDCRSRLDPPLPKTYFGTCICGEIVSAKQSDLVGLDGIAIAAELIGTVIKKMDNADEILESVEKMDSYDFPTMADHLLSVAGSAKLGAYETDFGWGIPKKTEVVSISATGAISLSECPNEVGAVEVGLVRNKIEMEAFISFFEKTIKGLA